MAISRTSVAVTGQIRGIAVLVGGVLAIAFVLEAVRPTEGMPNFSQAYSSNCDLCHAVPPALNAYGRYVQRTGYGSLDAGLIHKAFPVWLNEALVTDTQGMMPGKLQTGNLAIHAAGFIGNDITFHLHQWVVMNDMPGGTDTMWLTYNNLFHRDGHLFVGKMDAPAPAPFSNWFELTGFAPPAMTVGEHMYELDAFRWGGKLSYVRQGLVAQAGYFGPNGDLNTAFDFGTPQTDKTFQYRAAYARADKPIEAGLYGATGSFPLSDGTYDHYTAFAPYVQIDPQNGRPGVFALYQSNYDANAGPGFGAARSNGYTIEVDQPLFRNSTMLALRREMTDDGLGNVIQYGSADIGAVLSRHVSPGNANALILIGEVNMMTGSTPGWRAQLQFNTTLSKLR